jgi:2-polyprenyl-3-methyl-5-hydroxy-6-metoxy-1,4-benzoquinol methylase
MNTKKINAEVYSDENRYDYIKNRSHQIRIKKSIKIIKKYSEQKSEKLKILDVGCGTGEIAEQFQKLGLDIYGMDCAENQLELANRKGIKTKYGDMRSDFPYENQQFDVLFLGEVIEHLVDVRPFITEVNRVLKIGGLLVVTTPNLAGLNDRLRFLFGYNPRHTTPLSRQHYLHIRPFTYNTLKELLEIAGFAIKVFKSNKVRFNVFQGRDLDSYFLAKLFPKFGATLIFGAIKLNYVKKIKLYNV